MARPLLRSSTFKLTLLYISLFSTSVIILFAFIYWSTLSYMTEQADEALNLEIRGLKERYKDAGLNGLTQLIRDRINTQPPSGSTIYLLTSFRFDSIVGNLDRWPRGPEDAEGFIDFVLEDSRFEPRPVIHVRARAFNLDGGFRLLVGRGIEDLFIARKRIIWTLGWGLGIMVLLGLIGSILMSRGMLRRIDQITATSEQIVSGDLGRRVPTRGTGDDFDRLSEHLNRMLDQIESLLDSVRRISDNIAHDLKTPLTRLRNRLESMSHSGADFHHHLDPAIREADGLLSTFNALLRIARIENDARKEGFSSIRLEEVVADVVELYEPLAEEKLQTLTLEQRHTPPINGDRDLVFQAVANILDNAVKYTPENGIIQVSIKTGGKRVRVTVTDNGPGIPDALHEKVVQRFFRTDSSRNQSGNGLGLSMVAAVCKLHGAQLRFEELDPGLSVHMDFMLPVVEKQSKFADSASESDGISTNSSTNYANTKPSAAH
ncbi:MAG: two-component sensor histidine kinase [marine bacterium B5-7]|nr:MAG: two-component sensor histidine kinase [marine bacterium B5-7]